LAIEVVTLLVKLLMKLYQTGPNTDPVKLVLLASAALARLLLWHGAEVVEIPPKEIQ
jgi:hypothetical protein